MANITVSQTCLQQICSSQALDGTYLKFGDSAQKFYFMKGTPPTQSELNAAGANFRSTDRLWRSPNSSHNLTSFISDADGYLLKFSYGEMAAIGTGTATWWYWDCDPASSNTTTCARLSGTISVTGGGGDLEISNTTITNGELYAAGPITLLLPRNYTY